MKFETGERVTVGGDLGRWTATAQRNLPGTTGTVEQYATRYGSGSPVYLVEFDKPVQVNPVNKFNAAWIEEGCLSRLTTTHVVASHGGGSL